jgi:integrase
MAALLPRPVTEITRAEIVEACAALKSVETGQRLYRWLRGAVDHAVDMGQIERSQFGRNVPLNLVVPASARGSLRGNLDMDQMRTLFRASWDSDAAWAVRALHRVVALSGHRIGAARMAMAEHLDLAAGTWTMPRQLMKVKVARPDFVIRMSPQLKTAMVDAHRRVGGKGLLFKGPTTGAALSEESVEHHIRRLLPEGGKFTPHSWRSAILTWALESGHPREVAMATIDHQRSTGATARYDASVHADGVSEILAAWGDILDRE